MMVYMSPMKRNIEELRKKQEEIARNVDLTNHLPALDQLQTVAGADISFGRFSKTGYGAIVVFSYPEMELLEATAEVETLDFPYIPGYLAFREWPLVEKCLNQLSTLPQVLICDGQGLAHPRKAGLACHIGVETGLITVGCAKTRLVGDYNEPAPQKGAKSDLTQNGEKIGEVVRTKTNVKPVYVSPGHKIDFPHATDLILALTTKYRLPETTRTAHHLVNELRKKSLEQT